MSAKAVKKTLPPEEIIAGKKQQLDGLRVQCYQIERMLAICTDQQSRLDAENADLQRNIAVTEQQIEDADRSLDENVTFMRNYTKQSDEQLKSRQERLLKSVADAETENATLRLRLHETRVRKEEELLKWEEEATALQRQMDEKALLFGMQLKEAIERVQHGGTVGRR